MCNINYVYYTEHTLYTAVSTCVVLMYNIIIHIIMCTHINMHNMHIGNIKIIVLSIFLPILFCPFKKIILSTFKCS